MDSGAKTDGEMHVNGDIAAVETTDLNREEAEVFEEALEMAMETPRENFLTPHHRDSRESAFKIRADEFDEEEPHLEVSKFDCLVDQSSGPSHKSIDAEGSPDVDSYREGEAQMVVLQAARDAELDHFVVEHRDTIDDGEVIDGNLEATRDQFVVEHSDTVGNGDEVVADGPAAVATQYAERDHFVVEHSDTIDNGEVIDGSSDGSYFVVPEKHGNGESHEVGSEEPVAVADEAPLRPDVSDGSNGPLVEQTADVRSLEELVQTGSGTERSAAEDLVQSSSSNDFIQSDPSPASPPPTSSPVDLGASALPSHSNGIGSSVGTPSLPSLLTVPAGLGSSALTNLPNLPSHRAGQGSSAPTATDTPPLASRPDGLGSTLPVGVPSLRPSGPSSLSSAPKAKSSSPSHPDGLGSSHPAGVPSLRPSGPSGLSSAPTGAPSLPPHPALRGSSTPTATGVPPLTRPVGLGLSAPLLEAAQRSLQPPRANGSLPQRTSHSSKELTNDDAGDTDETREKLQMIRVKFLRLALRLGQTPHNVVVAQVLYRLGLAEQLSRNTNRPGVFSFDQASIMAEHLEAGGQEPLDFSCTIMVIGKTGVGKSSTINSIFDEVKFHTNAFQPSTKKVQEIIGTVQGIKVRVIDTPGLYTSSSDQRHNERVVRSVKKFISKTSPDIVLYIDRLDMQSRDFGDVPLLRTVTDVFGASIWFNAIVVLTHAASAPPDGPNGAPLSYEMFVTQRSHVVQQAIRQAAGDVRLMNPVSLVENHTACRTNRAGERVLPNGQVWKPQLLLLSFASKILAEANMLLQLQDGPPDRARARAPPLPFLLNSLLQTRAQLRLPEEQFDDEDTLDDDLDEASDSDAESDYDDLPPIKCLTKAQLDKLNKAQKKAYFEELDYREKLFIRKQLKQEKKRRRLMKKMAEASASLPSDQSNENLEEDESSGPASVPVPMPDYALPASFDSDNPSHRYRFLDCSSSWLVRPVLDSQGWDHDVGYESLNVERLFVVKEKIPLSVSGQLTKDKKEFNLQMEAASSIKHSEGKATSVVVDMQTVGKDMAYTLRGETMFKNFRRNNTTAGVSVTKLGDSVSAGVKVEDKLIVTNNFRLLMSGGAMHGRGDVAYGGRLEATLRDKDYPIGKMLTTLALSIVDWHGDMAIGCNFQSHIPLGRGTNLIGHANLSNRGSGQVGIRLNSSEHLQIALLALIPVLKNVKRVLLGSSQSM